MLKNAPELCKVLAISSYISKRQSICVSMKYSFCLFVLALASIFTSCSDSDIVDSPEALYAIVKPEEAQLIDIIPSDYVITLNDIIAVNPKTGEFKMKNTDRIDSKSFPIPVQYEIVFYSNGERLFSARLNSLLSSYMPHGLTFCHFMTDKNGLARYDFAMTSIMTEDGKIENNPTEEQERGLQRMYDILQKAGKVSSSIDYDFQF